MARLVFSAQQPLSDFPDGSATRQLQARSMRRQRHFLAGRWCARQALQHAGHQGECQLERDALALPRWPEQWLGSISHTKGKAIAVVGHSSVVDVLGADVEHIMDTARATRLRKGIATDAELALLADMNTEQRVTLLFSAKEALYKALYPQTQQFVGFDAAQLMQQNGDQLVFGLTRDWSTLWTRKCQIRVAFWFSATHIHAIACQPQVTRDAS